MAHLPLQIDAVPFESLAQLAVVAGTLVLLLMLVALGAFAYRTLVGDGIEWPDEESDEEGGVTRNHGDDEWKYS